LVVPPILIARRFSDLVGPFDLKIAANNEESQTLASIRDSLLPKLLSGKIRVT